MKRVRPLLGTYVSVTLTAKSGADEAITRAFQKAQELEKMFSKFNEHSEICHLNNAAVGEALSVHPHFYELLLLAIKMWKFSGTTFNPFAGEYHSQAPLFLTENRVCKIATCRVDLTGIAKGYIVDRLVEELNDFSGLVNAGGDLRFFNCTQPIADLRFENGLRQLNMTEAALATSNMSAHELSPNSTTEYFLKPRDGLTDGHSVSVMASSCAVADALCKVGWFASADVARLCAEQFHARILCFDRFGEVSEAYP